LDGLEVGDVEGLEVGDVEGLEVGDVEGLEVGDAEGLVVGANASVHVPALIHASDQIAVSSGSYAAIRQYKVYGYPLHL
jgi:hypothetical protein